MRKEDTPMRISRRKYEEEHFNERREANKVWGTSVPREFANELDDFLKKNNLSKASFLYMSFEIIKEKYNK
jgi:hypothetical protein